jgi:hypothetical protein
MSEQKQFQDVVSLAMQLFFKLPGDELGELAGFIASSMSDKELKLIINKNEKGWEVFTELEENPLAFSSYKLAISDFICRNISKIYRKDF